MVLGAFRKLRGAVRGDDGRAKAQGYLKPIDTDEIAREMDLARVAAERGRQDLPLSNTAGADTIEQQITQALEAEWAWHGAELINNLRAYAARLIAVSIPTELANLRLRAQNTLSKLRNAHHRAEADFGPIRQVIERYGQDAPFGLRFDIYTFQGDTTHVLQPKLKICALGKVQEPPSNKRTELLSVLSKQSIVAEVEKAG